MADADATIAAVAREQHGLVTRERILATITRRQLEHRLADGRLERVHACVYRVAGAPRTWEQVVLAACLTAGPRSHASFRAAARLWMLSGFETADDVEITTPSRRRARINGVVVHDSEVTGRRHTARRHGIPVSSPARTLCDLTACCRPWDVERALDDALRKKITTLRSLQAVSVDLAGPGRRRCTVMRALLEARSAGFDPGGSAMELRLVDWLVATGLPRPVQQHRVRLGNRSIRLDLAYPDQLIAIEYDGWDAHRSRRSFAGDRARQNELEIRGWLVLRFTSASMRDDVVRAVSAALATRTRAHM
jgi:hypothetical protein